MVISSILSFIVQILMLGALLPLLPDFIALEQSGMDSDPQAVFDTLAAAFTHPMTITGFLIAFFLAYLMQIVLEGMWHSVGAYNAVRHAGSEGADLDAPVLGADHPVGASPGEG
jgi:uncharacterized membrane protein YdbT with pleckstrin-like domain